MSLSETPGARTRGIQDARPRPATSKYLRCITGRKFRLKTPIELIDVSSTSPTVDSKQLFREAEELRQGKRLQIPYDRRERCLFPDLIQEEADPWSNLHETTHSVPSLLSETDTVISESAKLLSRICDRPEHELIALIKDVLSEARHQATSPEEEKVLESFIGYVDHIEEGTAYVRLTSQDHGDSLYGEYPASELASHGIHEQTRFRCQTVQVGENTRLDLTALPDVELSAEDLRAIEEKIDRVIPRDDPGIEY